MTRRILTIMLGLAVLPFGVGCSSMSNTAQGAGIGGATGAGIGALIGAANHGKVGQGALIGGLAGAAIGGAIGNEKDQKEKADAQAKAYAAAHPPTTVDEVIRMTQDRTPESVIINQIRSTNSVYVLSTEDVERMNANGVSPNVIMEMQNRRPGNVVPARVVTVPPPGPVYVVGPPPPPVIYAAPPPPVGVGVIFHSR